MFEATDELLGVHLPDPNTTAMLMDTTAAGGGQLQTTAIMMHSMGRLHHHQPVFVTTSAAAQQQNAIFNPAQQLSGGTYQLHLGRSLRQGRSVVMTVVRPRGVSGRPVAEFLPGELRNKDYVKGYMASEIYKKAVKDTLGQKSTPKK